MFPQAVTKWPLLRLQVIERGSLKSSCHEGIT